MKTNLFYKFTIDDFRAHLRELAVLIVCETMLIAVAYAGAEGYQMFANARSYEFFLQEGGVSRMFVNAGKVLLFCGFVIVITVLISYLGKRVPEYMLLKRLGISRGDFVRMVAYEAGIIYVVSAAAGFVLGKALSLILRLLLTRNLGIDFSLGSVSVLTYPIICAGMLLIYILGFLLLRDLESDFRVITNTSETSRTEKLCSKLTIPKIIIGIPLLIYPALAYSKTYNFENVLLYVSFFAGLYLVGRNAGALILRHIRSKNPDKYYRNLLNNNRLYFRPNTVARYILFFAVIGFLICQRFGMQIITISAAEDAESLYPYDFMCLADDSDDEVLEQIRTRYDAEITEYPMVRVATADMTERMERVTDTFIQGQEIGISESTYHALKKALDPSYEATDLGLDPGGEKIYIVHQQDSSAKAQPLDWYYGKSEPDIHIGVPCTAADYFNRNSTYYEKTVAGEETGSLTGCYSTERCENIVVFSDEYFAEAQDEWKHVDAMLSWPDEAMIVYGEEPVHIQGPTKLVLINADSAYTAEIDALLEEREPDHMYIGNYDPSVKFHYSSEQAIKDLKTGRAIKSLLSMYIMAVLIAMDIIMLHVMCQMERKEKTAREMFLKRMGMTPGERRKLNNRELMRFAIVPGVIIAAATIIFSYDMCAARMYTAEKTTICMTQQVILLAVFLAGKGICFAMAGKIFGKEIGVYDE